MSKANAETLTLEPLGMDSRSLVESIHQHLTYSLTKTPETATQRDWFHALAAAVKDRLVERLITTFNRYYQQDTKRVYYLSLEFLIGRSLNNGIMNMQLEQAVEEALQQLGLEFEPLYWLEDEAALGNGGLGRLAACILDALATLDLPGYGYGIRYEYGMFSQRIDHGWQVESPENWLRYGNPWEIPRPEVLYPVHFYGRVVEYTGPDGQRRHQWSDTEQVMAMAYDMPIPGYGTDTVNNLRLWSAKSTRDFELQKFNQGNYLDALQYKTNSENLSRVLYPDDSTEMGRELRLKQEYFFVCATMQDILRRFSSEHQDWDLLPDKAVIQLNDTHPTLAIPELMRLLLDGHQLDWNHAWQITRRCFAYTNHTLLPEALETWPVHMIERILPRHLQIIYEINQQFLTQVMRQFPGDRQRLRRMSLIDEDSGRRVRMAHLAIVGSQRVNGVSELHSRLLAQQLFADFHRFNPDQLCNVTNGITPRRWLQQANPGLSRLISEAIGDGWQTDLSRLRELEPLAEDGGFRAAFREVKNQAQGWLGQVVQWRNQIDLLPNAMFDVQVKRIHEYKRQLLNLLHAVVLYNRVKDGVAVVPRNIIFGGKAAPGYDKAKRIIKLINDVGEVINHDPVTREQLRLVFLPNYDVSSAATIIPAADLSEQISTSGMEASGTGNMKFSLNGALTIGTLDGANIEIREEVGEEHFFLFGMTAEQVDNLRYSHYQPRQIYDGNEELRRALDQIASGFFSADDAERHRPLVQNLLHQDTFFVLADFADYLRCQQQVSELFLEQEQWSRKALINVARMGKFSIDRTVAEYARNIWQVEATAT